MMHYDLVAGYSEFAVFFFSSRRRHTRFKCDWSSDVCSSDLFRCAALRRPAFVRLSAIRKLVGEARRNGMIGLEEAANLSEIPNVRQKGTRLEIGRASCRERV